MARRLDSAATSAGVRKLIDPSLFRRTDSVLAQLQGLVMDPRANPTKYISVRLF